MPSRSDDEKSGSRPPAPGDAATAAAKVNQVRRRLLLGTAVVGVGGAAAAIVRDGELGGPSQTIRGAVPWQEGSADAPPGASGTGFVFFTATEAAFIEAAVGAAHPERSGRPRRGRGRTCPSSSTGSWPDLTGSGDHYLPRRPLAQGHAGTGLPEPLQPAQLYRAAIAAIDKYVGARISTARSFAKLTAADQDNVLKGLESRRRSSSTTASTARPSSPCCCRTPRRATSPTRSTAATRTWAPGR